MSCSYRWERLASSDHTLRRCPALPGWKNDAKCKNLCGDLQHGGGGGGRADKSFLLRASLASLPSRPQLYIPISPDWSGLSDAGFCWFGCSIWCRWWNDHQSRLLIHLSLWEALRLNSLSSSSSNNPGLFSSIAEWGGRLCSVASSTWKPEENLQHWLEGKIEEVHLHLLDSANCYTTTILGQKSNFGHFWTATLYILTKGTLPR